MKEAFIRIYTGGTYWRTPDFFQRVLTSKKIKLKPKTANIAGVQLSDLLAYSIKQDIFFESRRITDPGDVFGKKICQVAIQKYNRHLYRGYVEGYGRTLLK